MKRLLDTNYTAEPTLLCMLNSVSLTHLVRFEFVPRMAQAFPMHGTSFSHAWYKLFPRVGKTHGCRTYIKEKVTMPQKNQILFAFSFCLC